MRWLRLISILMLIGTVAVMAARAEELRALCYSRGSGAAARAWQNTVRTHMAGLLRIDELIAARAKNPLAPRLVEEHIEKESRVQEIEACSTPGRKFRMLLFQPMNGKQAKRPAIVCIHGHGGTRYTPYDAQAENYKQFGRVLAQRGFITISTDAGQHEVYEDGRTLMGERLWDLMRCVDYLETLPDVDPVRIGCAGLSLGGEMAMWLGAMDGRIAATSSCGFLTYMDQMEHNHCLCWKFPGLRGLVDFPDIYALIAPRWLQCQNGLKEPETQFTVPLARKAMEEVLWAYSDMHAQEKAGLHVHTGGHEIDMDAMTAFFQQAFSASTQ